MSITALGSSSRCAKKRAKCTKFAAMQVIVVSKQEQSVSQMVSKEFVDGGITANGTVQEAVHMKNE